MSNLKSHFDFAVESTLRYASLRRKTRTERLSRLAMKLARLRPTNKLRFDLGGWLYESDCGTTACAVGCAMLDPWFKRRGLGGGTHSRPTYRTWEGWSAVTGFFGISQDAALFLFAQSSYARKDRKNPKVVAQRIRAFLKALEA